MAVIACATCRKLLDVDPVKCPYCGVIQSNRAVDVRNRRLRLAVLAVCGVGMGLTAGRSAGRPAIRKIESPAMQGVRTVTPASLAFEENVRNRARHLAPYRLVDVEELYLTPEKVAGQKVAVPGLISEAHIEMRRSWIQLCRQWGTSTSVTVDIGALFPDYQKTLVKNRDARHVYLVKGEVRPGSLSPLGEKFHIAAQEIEPLGETDGLDGVARAEKILSEGAGAR